MASGQKELKSGLIEIYGEEVLGVGSYGKVCKAKCGQLPCAAKVLHDIMFEPGSKFVKQFEQECQFLKAIKHPNIVQYLDVSKDPQSERPVLLMELMDDSLTRFLKRSTGPLPYHTQLNICQDVALALAYLHSNDIIHRDLSSNNVLLIGEGNRAKVTDFGMSKLEDIQNAHMTQQTLCPGTQVYMPPEALISPPRYSSKLDCFSHGVLTIQIATRQFPNPGDAMTTVEDVRSPTGTIQVPVAAIECRKKDINLVDSDHPLLPLALHCLKDRDTERPSADELCEGLATLKCELRYTDSVELSPLQILQQQLEEKDNELKNELRTCHQKAEEKCQKIKDSYEKSLREHKFLINQLRSQVATLQQANLQPVPKDLLQLSWREANPAPETMGSYWGAAVVHDNTAYFSQGHVIRSFTLPQGEWTDSITCLYKYFSLAVVKNKLTTIGGCRGSLNNTLLSLSPDKSLAEPKSKSMPRTQQGWLDSFKYKFLGDDPSKSPRMSVNLSGPNWEELLPPMPTARARPAVVTTQTHLVVAGGRTTEPLERMGNKMQVEHDATWYKPLSAVEVLDIEVRQWSRVCELPTALHGPHMALSDGRLYVSANNVVLSSTMNDLLSPDLSEDSPPFLQDELVSEPTPDAASSTHPANPSESNVWTRLADIPVQFGATLVSCDNHLLAVGGSDKSYMHGGKLTAAVHQYNRRTNSWSEIGEMPTPRSGVLATSLPCNVLVVVGGEGRMNASEESCTSKITEVAILTYKKLEALTNGFEGSGRRASSNSFSH